MKLLRVPAGALLLLLAVAAGAAALEPRSSSAAVLHRFRAMSEAKAATSATVSFDSLQSLITNVVAEPDLSQWPAAPSMVVLKKMFEEVTHQARGYANTLTMAALQDAVRLNHGGAAHLEHHIVDDAQFEFFKKLRATFPKSHQYTANPTVEVVGEGPAGLSAAIEARRLGKAATVALRGARPSYYRQHVVTTWRTKSIGGYSLGTTGIEELLKQKLGIATAVPLAHPANYNYAFYHAFKWEEEDGGSRKIQICDLEKMLYLLANIVGVRVNPFRDNYAAAHASRAIQRNAAKVAAMPLHFAAATDATTPFAAPVAAAGYAGAADVVVGADGAGSEFRRDNLPDARFVPPLLFTTGSPAGTAGPNMDISDTLRAKGGLVTAGFVMRFPDLVDAAAVCGTAKNTDAGGFYFLDKPRDADPGIEGFYTKSFAVKNVCQLEVQFKKEAGRALISYLGGADGSYNYNLKSPTPAGLTHVPKLALLRMVLGRALRDSYQKPSEIQRIFGRVTEFKVWQNNLCMSLPSASLATEGFANDDNKPLMARRHNDRLFVLVGDSAREALPNSGMGVNDAHGMAQLLGEEIKNIGRQWANQGNRRTGMDAVQTALGDHEREVVKGLHGEVRPSVVTDPNWGNGHRILHNLAYDHANQRLSVGTA